MKTVGLRELKNRLSEYVRVVRRGQSVLVTNRGEVVAELRAPDEISQGAKIDPHLARLVNRGLITPGAPNTARVYPLQKRLLKSTTSAALLKAERGPR
jgi:antitoxin (DNA-binding transcriptional repressor) of toxin-antitoxin stability system